jgi:hypothetical protein
MLPTSNIALTQAMTAQSEPEALTIDYENVKTARAISGDILECQRLAEAWLKSISDQRFCCPKDFMHLDPV